MAADLADAPVSNCLDGMLAVEAEGSPLQGTTQRGPPRPSLGSCPAEASAGTEITGGESLCGRRFETAVSEGLTGTRWPGYLEVENCTGTWMKADAPLIQKPLKSGYRTMERVGLFSVFPHRLLREDSCAAMVSRNHGSLELK